MADVNEEVMAFVEAELKKTPDLKSGDLFEKAKSMAPEIGDLSLRQFHARYPLQVKRRASAAGSGSSKKKSAAKARSRKKSGGREKAKAPSASAPRTRRARGRSKGTPTDSREAVRGVLMRFATELASADAKADVVRVLAGADRYVDEVMEAAAS